MQLEVVAGVLYDAHGRVLIAERPAGKVLAGWWEFPGGKRGVAEAPYEALVRELREELGIEVLAAEPLMRFAVDYPDRTVWLDAWTVTAWRGEARGLESQAIRWIEPKDLPGARILAADRPIIEAVMRGRADA